MSELPRVLVIDDDPLFRGLLSALLKPYAQVAVAQEGSEGYFKALQHLPDVAVIDIQMPGWDGFKTLKRFRGNPQLARISTIVLTSDSTRDTVLGAIDSGADEYLIKTSFSQEEILEKLSRLKPDLFSSTGIAPRSELAANFTPQSPPAPHSSPGSTSADDPGLLMELIDGWE